LQMPALITSVSSLRGASRSRSAYRSKIDDVNLLDFKGCGITLAQLIKTTRLTP
jgi:hypothetical protein